MSKHAQKVQAMIRLANAGTPVQQLTLGAKQNWEYLYYQALQAYKYKQYEQAEEIFLLLCLSDPSQERYWLGAGLATLKQKRYAEAARTFMKPVNLHDSRNPWLVLHCAQCLLKLEHYEETTACLDLAADSLPGHPDEAEISRRLQGLRLSVEKKRVNRQT